jgi:hypothetical protein
MLLLQEENAAKSEKDGRYNDALDYKRERNNAPQPTCVWLRFQSRQYLGSRKRKILPFRYHLM